MVEKSCLGAGVILDLFDRVPKDEYGNHQISMIEVDNFFDWLCLIEGCSKRTLAISVTLRQNRVENALISNKKANMKMARG